ncbi:glyoxalase [Tersicoccus solisilvae]|uniref:Glyoxalase n=1 Tax=Tersicoccus solisilvae TaxID=1882339 RepID=A0ABQ1P4Z6_9MICC|nr:VOC family protein [Tersicoccus solisilvae]GGC90903.1 glyoxalase [Tersicoccus solisilvae]
MPVRHEPWPEGTPCWIDAQVEDVSAAADYYRGLFGWTVEDAGEAAGHYHLARLDGEIVGGLGPKPADMRDGPATWTTYLAADDVDATASRITAAGGQLLMPPFDVMTQGRLAVAADTTGAVFGVWQAGRRSGITRYSEHGADVWNELHTRAYDDARAFYAAVFGYHYRDVGDGAGFVYCTFHPAPDAREIGGISASAGAGSAPDHWLTWFAADDVDATTERAVALGATVLVQPGDSGFGRRSVVTGPQGEVFGLITTPPAAATD